MGQPGAYPDVPVLAAPVVALGTIGWIPADLGVVEGDEIPYQPWAAARQQENFADVLDRDPEVRCYLPGVPRAMYMPHKFQIIQGTTKVMMAFEFRNADRTIHLDEVALYPADAYMGHSVGRWEGDTLVVDVTRFTPYTWLDRSGNFHSDALHVVERYTPLGRDAIQYEATIEDPKVFTRPWTIRLPLYRRLEPDVRLVPFRCMEMAEETALGHLRRTPLVERWEGKTMILDVTRRVPSGGGGSLPTPDFRQSARVGPAIRADVDLETLMPPVEPPAYGLGAPVPDDPRKSVVPSGRVRSRPLARREPSFERYPSTTMAVPGSRFSFVNPRRNSTFGVPASMAHFSIVPSASVTST